MFGAVQRIVESELEHGDAIHDEWTGKFGRAKRVVVLRYPFRKSHIGVGITRGENRDEHYPVGKFYQDIASGDMVLAPFS